MCQIIGSYRPVIGGAERATETLVGALAERGEDVVVLTRRFAATDAAVEMVKGVPVYRLGAPGHSKQHAVTFGLHALWLLATRFRRFRVLHVQDMDMSMLVGIVASLLPGRRLVTTIHGEWPIIGRSRTWTGRLRIRAMVYATDRFTSINPENTRQLVRAGAGRECIREIPNGIDEAVYRPAEAADRAAARVALGLEPDEFVALYQGRLQPYKRVDLLIDAWSHLPPDFRGRLLIVGTGPEEDRLRNQAEDIESVRVDGPTDNPLMYLQAADVFVNPSGDPAIAWSEGLSVALLEAAFMSVCPIVTRSPGNDVIVKDRVTGLNFEMGDRDGLTGCLAIAIRDQDLRMRLGWQAHDSVVDSYSATAVASQIAAMYREFDP